MDFVHDQLATGRKLTVRKRGCRKRAIGTRAPMLIPLAANDRWSLDFVSDQLTDGRRFRVPMVVDDCARECLALVADTSLSGQRVTRELERIIEGRGKPKMIVSDNGSEFTSNAILQWTDRTKVEWHYIPPGKPIQNEGFCVHNGDCGHNDIGYLDGLRGSSGFEGSFQREAAFRSRRERPADRRCNEARGIGCPSGTGARRQRQSVTQLGEASPRSAGPGCFAGCCRPGNIGLCSGSCSIADCAAGRHAGPAVIRRNAADCVFAKWCAA